MITESDEYRRDERLALVFALCASLLCNALAWMLSLWIAGLHLHLVIPQSQIREMTASSSSITLERRTVAKIARNFAPPVPRQAAAPRRVAAAPKEEMTAPPRPQTTAPAEHPVQEHTLSQQLAEQEQTFAKEAQQLRASRATLSEASAAPLKPSSFQRNFLDLNGVDRREHVEALLLPFKHWTDGDQSCYLVSYYAQFSGGGTEQGNIPWPLCYPAAHDAMLPINRPHLLPIPYPPPHFPLPPGTALGPLLQGIYNGTIHA